MVACVAGIAGFIAAAICVGRCGSRAALAAALPPSPAGCLQGSCCALSPASLAAILTPIYGL